jgi:hypothetical protein
MWEDLIQKAKDGGIDVIETYVFWNVHEPTPGNVLIFLLLVLPLVFALVSLDLFSCIVWMCGLLQYHFEGRYDIVRFMKTIQRAGLYAHLRIGPYVCAEWNFGYLPLTSSLSLDLADSSPIVVALQFEGFSVSIVQCRL